MWPAGASTPAIGVLSSADGRVVALRLSPPTLTGMLP
jgi:hypothetical protein